MTPRHHPVIRHCPLCGIAMQLGKTPENPADFDTFRCLSCDTTIREIKAQKRVARGGGEE
jgi:hypothetical protein